MVYFQNILLGAGLFTFVSSHATMKKPMALWSPHDNTIQWPEQPDYNPQDSLYLNGTNFPCKGYHHQPPSKYNVQTFQAGGTYELELEVGADHKGGSCELSLSYDNGLTWRVFKRYIGSCPAPNHWTASYKLPDWLPAQEKVLFSWSWLAKTGNREMWQNCAIITIENPQQPKNNHKDKFHRDSRFESLPRRFRGSLSGFDLDCYDNDNYHSIPTHIHPDVDEVFGKDNDGVEVNRETYQPRHAIGECDNDFQDIEGNFAYKSWGGINRMDCSVAPIVPCNSTWGWPFRATYIQACKGSIPEECQGTDTGDGGDYGGDHGGHHGRKGGGVGQPGRGESPGSLFGRIEGICRDLCW